MRGRHLSIAKVESRREIALVNKAGYRRRVAPNS